MYEIVCDCVSILHGSFHYFRFHSTCVAICVEVKGNHDNKQSNTKIHLTSAALTTSTTSLCFFCLVITATRI